MKGLERKLEQYSNLGSYQLLYKVSDLDQWKEEQTYSDIGRALDNARDWLEDGYIVQILELA